MMLSDKISFVLGLIGQMKLKEVQRRWQNVKFVIKVYTSETQLVTHIEDQTKSGNQMLSL